MLSYKYDARDSATGQVVHSTVEAADEASAAKLIRDEGLVPINIAVVEVSAGFKLPGSNKVKAKDKVLFSRQLATLINAGLPLVQALRSVINTTQSAPLKVIISKIITDVEAGSTFSAALAKHPDVFSQIYLSLIESGEASGTLDAALERLAFQQEKDADTISKLRNAMIYPIIVLAVMLGVLSYMIISVLPQVEALYESVDGATLPWITQMLLAVTHFFMDFWYIVAIVLGVAIFFFTRWARSLGGKTVIDRLKMQLPPFGMLFRKMYMARFARTGSTLIASGVPLIQVLEITAKAISNVHVEKSILAAAEKVKGGKSLGEALNHDPNFLELVPNMLKIGEQSGSTEEMLGKVADYYEKEVDDQIKSISTIIEPLMMLLLGVGVIVIVVAVLLPIYALAGGSGNLGG